MADAVGSDSSDPTPEVPPGAESVAFAQRFVITRPDGDDLAGVRFASGRVIADEPGEGLTGATCFVFVANHYPRCWVVWERDQPPVPCCPDGPHEPPTMGR